MLLNIVKCCYSPIPDISNLAMKIYLLTQEPKPGGKKMCILFAPHPFPVHSLMNISHNIIPIPLLSEGRQRGTNSI